MICQNINTSLRDCPKKVGVNYYLDAKMGAWEEKL